MTTDSLPTERAADEASEPDGARGSDTTELGDKGRHAVETLSALLDKMGFEAEVVQATEGERIEIEIEGPDAGRVIGKKGQTLDALQFIVNKIVNRFPEGRRHVVLDVEGYKERRDESLAAMAERMAEKVLRSGKSYTFSPMPSRERRVVHLALADYAGVSTRSDGQGPDRRVRIIPDSGRRRSNTPR